MADARLPSHWHGNPDFDDLSDHAWRVFTGALMWSNAHSTDGFIPKRYIKNLHPDGSESSALDDLLKAGVGVQSTDGYQMTGWEKNLGQSSAAQVEHNKDMNRIRQASFRRSQAKKSARSPTFEDDVTGDVTRYVGQDRDKTGRDNEALQSQESENVNLQTGEVEDPASTWHGASISRSSSSKSTLTARETDSTPLDSDEATVTTAVSAEWEHVNGRTRRVRKSA